ncbi:MAG: hypothetical protein H6636_00190 [Anaerolineales bacterium]|nr:hypothetical protein [Anaerolineales bacterium]
MAISNALKKVTGLSKGGLWTLFLLAAFPTHVWTIVLVLRDFSWVSERTNAWDAVGVGAYGLLIAFVESLFVFLIAVILSSLLRFSWQENKRLVLFFILILAVSLWAMVNQLHFMAGWTLPTGVFWFLTRQTRPLVVFYLLMMIVVGVTVLLPVYFVLRSDKFVRGLQGVIERISLLMTLYLVLDVGSLVIVMLRNL